MTKSFLAAWRSRTAPLGTTTLLTAVLTLSVAAPAQVLQQRIPNPLPLGSSSEREFGYSVDISGDALIVGSPNAPSLWVTPHSGVAIYERIGGTWTKVLDLMQSFPADDRAGWDVAIDGDWAAFGVFADFFSGISGEVHIYQRVAGSWVSSQTLTAPLEGFVEFFGNAIDIDGDIMAIGSVFQGTVWLYRLQGTVWTEIGSVQAPPAYQQVDSNFAESVAVSDTPAREAVIVGQPLYSPVGGFQDGVAHIYANGTSGWSLVNTVLPGFPGSDNAWFGFRVALDGDVAVAGAVRAFEHIPPFTANGAATIFRWNGSTFALSKLIVGDEGEYAGWAVAADGDRVYVGRPYWTGIDSGPPLDAGRVTGERWTGSAWTPWPGESGSFHRIAQPLVDFQFGQALAAADGRLVVGTPEANIAGADHAGSICVLDVSKEGWKWMDAQIFGADMVVGSTGPARLRIEGSLGGGDGYRIHLHDALPNTLAAMFVGLSAINAPFKGGILVPNPQYTLWFPTNASGAFHVTTVFPNGVPAGVTLWHHMWWPDAGGPVGFASSNAVRGITP